MSGLDFLLVLFSRFGGRYEKVGIGKWKRQLGRPGVSRVSPELANNGQTSVWDYSLLQRDVIICRTVFSDAPVRGCWGRRVDYMSGIYSLLGWERNGKWDKAFWKLIKTLLFCFNSFLKSISKRKCQSLVWSVLTVTDAFQTCDLDLVFTVWWSFWVLTLDGKPLNAVNNSAASCWKHSNSMSVWITLPPATFAAVSQGLMGGPRPATCSSQIVFLSACLLIFWDLVQSLCSQVISVNTCSWTSFLLSWTNINPIWNKENNFRSGKWTC